MCGIAGIVNFNGKKVDFKQVETLTEAVQHRGPDGKGIWFNSDSSLAFGHRRLSILDESEKGLQPMSFDNGRYWITLNGEIYNFIELRELLKEKGSIFTTETDTEVVLAAYKIWGLEMLERFNGMWAMGIYDVQEKTLILSRDRYGVKPLYYFLNNNQLLFSSEVQAIHKIVGNNHALNETVLKDIANGGFYNHGTIETYLKDVYSLPGGYNLIVNNNEVEIKKWYELPKLKVPETFKKQADYLRELIKDACLIRMRSDVPVATCLSGGLDSGTITAMISNFEPEQVNRFNNYTHKGYCASFPNTPLDESNDAKRLAKQLNTQIDVLEIKPPSPFELIEAMKKCDGPMHSLAFYPIWNLYKHIRENNIIVTLDGQGPDEMLGGYRPLKEALQTAIELKKFSWFNDVYNTYSEMGESEQFSSKQFAKNERKKVIIEETKWFIKNKFNQFSKNNTRFNTKNVGVNSTKFNGNLKMSLTPVRMADPADNIFNRNLYGQFFQSPLPGILQQYDRCSMANGVECRMPFLDYRIVEYLFSLPIESKVGNGYTKRILREAVKDILPNETRLNKTKLGFNAPLVDWFNGPLKSFMLEHINSEEFICSKYFDGKKIKQDFDNFIETKSNNWNDAWKFWGPVHITWWLKNIPF